MALVRTNLNSYHYSTHNRLQRRLFLCPNLYHPRSNPPQRSETPIVALVSSQVNDSETFDQVVCCSSHKGTYVVEVVSDANMVIVVPPLARLTVQLLVFIVQYAQGYGGSLQKPVEWKRMRAYPIAQETSKLAH
jgi:hypothetical protein